MSEPPGPRGMSDEDLHIRYREEDTRIEQARIRRRLYRRRARRRSSLVVWGLSGFLALTLLFGIAFGTKEKIVVAQMPETGERIVAPAGDLEEDIRAATTDASGRFGIYIRDPSDAESYALNEKKRFMAASLAKLPVLLALYSEAAAGDINLEERIYITQPDVQNYGSGKLMSYPVGYGMTLRECARVMIHDSDNTAWVMLERRLGEDRISQEINALDLEGTDYETLTTTPQDVFLMLEAISDASYTSPGLSGEMLDAMTDTAYETRLPASLPDDVRVAHKVGSLDKTFSDAGIVFAKQEGRVDYLIVVICEGIPESRANRTIRIVSSSAFQNL